MTGVTVDRSTVANIGKEYTAGESGGAESDHPQAHSFNNDWTMGVTSGVSGGMVQVDGLRGGHRVKASKAGAIEEKYRVIRQQKMAAKDQANLILGRRTLQSQATRDAAAATYLGNKSSDRWVK